MKFGRNWRKHRKQFWCVFYVNTHTQPVDGKGRRNQERATEISIEFPEQWRPASQDEESRRNNKEMRDERQTDRQTLILVRVGKALLLVREGESGGTCFLLHKKRRRNARRNFH